MILNIFFSIKLIRQFRGAKKNFRGGQINEKLIEKHCFSKSKEAAGPWPKLNPPLKCNIQHRWSVIPPLALRFQIQILTIFEKRY
jgi:hypothetical protein